MKRWLKHYDDGVPHQIDYPHIPLYQILEETTLRHPERPCTRFFGRQFSYRQIQEQSSRLASALQNLGVKKGDKVALLLPNAPQFIIAYYGILKAGAVVVPLNPLYTARELEFHLGHSESRTVITIPLFLDKVCSLRELCSLERIIYSRLADYMPLPLSMVQNLQETRLVRQAGGRLIDFRRLLQTSSSAAFQPEPVDPDETAVLIYSGGTTGLAKGIMLSHLNLVANAHQIQAWGKPTETMRILAILPLFHGFGMSLNMNTPILVGGETILLPRFKAREVVQAIQKCRPTFLIGVPTMFVALCNQPRIERYDFSSIEGVFVGAAPLTAAIKENFEAKTGGRMIEGYGLTEAVTAIMANPYRGRHKVGSIGIPFPDVMIRIVSLEDGKDLPPGEQGEIVLKSPTVMRGYYKQPEESCKTVVDGWLYTGDIGTMDEDGYFFITDRKKDLIIVGGFNVFPREIDELIYQHPKVKEGITLGLPDPYQGERIKVYIVLKEGETAGVEEFVSYFRENLVPYKVPSQIEFRTHLPKSALGKILRRALQEEEQALRGETAGPP